MHFVENLSLEEYQAFFDKFPYSHFLQSITWGETNKETRGKEPIYIGLKDQNNNLVAAALLLKKSMPFNMCYYYCPRGYLIDFNNTLVLEEFTKHIRLFLHKTKAIYLKINPEIMYQEINSEGQKIENGQNNYSIVENLKKLGYIHQGFVKLYENNEPRYTFRRYMKDYESMEDIDKSISKTYMKTVRRSFTYNLKVDYHGNLKDFFALNKSNAEKNGFIQYPDKFYQSLYQNGQKYHNILVFNISVNGKELYHTAKESYNKLKQEIDNNLISKKNKADSEEKLTRLKNEIAMFEEYQNQDDFVICSMINGIANNMLWTMYIGNNKLGEYLFAVNRVYYETIKYCFENNYKFIDLYGTVGDPHTKYKNLGGLHQYKAKFGDQYIEFIGEFDLINKPFWYKVLPFILNIYRKIIRLLKK